MLTKLRVPFHFPSVGGEEIDEVVETLKSGWLTTGPRTARFEKEFAEYVEAPLAQAVNSCTAGLHLVLAALNIGPGDEVITTPLTFCATVNVIMQVGAMPVLADVLPDGNIDPACIAKKINRRTKAIIPVHLAGMPCEMDDIWSLAKRHGLHVIEDCAHAAGTKYRGRPIGAAGENTGDSSSAACVFSFYATKNITTGEGGMITMGDPKLADRVKVLCLHGINRDAWNRYSDEGSWYYEVLEPGFKYNMSDIQSAIGIHQLRKLDNFIDVRQQYAEIYREMLGDVDGVEIPEEMPNTRSAWHLYMLRLRLDRLRINRRQFITELRHRGIGTSVHFIPIPLHPYFKELARKPENQCPEAIALYQRLVSLPLYPAMTVESVSLVANAVKDIAAKSRSRTAVYANASAI